jgi:hypothetical protein
MKPLEIEVVWHTDETRIKCEAGLPWDMDDCTWKTMTFYTISAIEPYDFDDLNKNICKIHSNNDYWIIPFSYEEVKKMIEQ